MNFRSAHFSFVFCLLLSISVWFANLEPRGADPGTNFEEFTFDDPDQATQLYLEKRKATDGRSEDLYDRYRLAMDRMKRMKRYSSRSGRYRQAAGEVSQETHRAAAGILADAWEPLGPGNIGGRTRALLINPENPSVLYTAGVSGGVWKSVSGGQAWEPLTDMLPNIAVSVLAMDPGDSSVIYAGTGEGHFREVVRGTGLPLRGAGVFRSRDAGAHWERLAGTTTSDFYWVNDLLVSSRDSSRLYAATRTGVWRSLDAGQSWTQVLTTSLLGGCFDLVQRTDTATDYLLASCGTFGQPVQAAIFRTVAGEGDLPWQQVHSEFGMGRTSLAISPSSQATVYALSASYLTGSNPNFDFNGGLLAVYRSDQGGAPGTWVAKVRNSDQTKLNTLLLSNPFVAHLASCGFGPGGDRASNLGWYTNVIAVDTVDPNVVFAGGVDLFRSDDGGANWGWLHTGGIRPPLHTPISMQSHSIPATTATRTRPSSSPATVESGVLTMLEARQPLARRPPVTRCKAPSSGRGSITTWESPSSTMGLPFPMAKAISVEHKTMALCWVKTWVDSTGGPTFWEGTGGT